MTTDLRRHTVNEPLATLAERDATIAALRAIREMPQDAINALAMLEWVRDRHDETYATAREDGTP